MFDAEIVPVSVPQRRGDPVVVARDEFPRPDTTLEALARLRPAFDPDGTVTAGSSSGINDGAAATVVMSAEAARELGSPVLATIRGYASVGVAPSVMGLGPVGAVRAALDRAGVALADIDLIELNEAFAAQSLAVCRRLGLDPDRTNVHGGAIALGHPIGGVRGPRAHHPPPRDGPPGGAPRARRAVHRRRPGHRDGGRATGVIAQAAPPPPAIVAGPPVTYGAIAVRLGAGTERIEVQRDGRLIARRDVPAGPRRLAVPLPAGAGAVRVRAIGRGGARWSATVRVRVLPRSALRAGRLPGFVDAPLQRDVDRLVGAMPAIAGVYVQNLVSGCGASYNADAQFPAASTLKAAILVNAVRRGRARELAPLLDRMIRDSDDRAANQVLAALGGGSGEAGAVSVTDTLHRLGLTRSLVRRPYILEDARRPLPVATVRSPALFTNFITTPYELSRLMVAIHRGALGRGGVGRLGIGSRRGAGAS